MDESPRDPRLGRRLLVLRVAGLGLAATGCTAQAAGPAGTTLARTDNDPRDTPGYGRGGYGGGYGSGYAPQRRNVTDNDPRDAEGRGRGYGYSPPPRRAVTDNDPRDSEGRGRGWR
jgi:hypothetical protein